MDRIVAAAWTLMVAGYRSTVLWLRTQRVGLFQIGGCLSAVYGVWALETERPGWWAIVAGVLLFVLAGLAENVD